MHTEAKQALISQWYEQYADDIFSVVLLMTGDFQQAEDLTHDTFLQAYKKMETYRGEANPKTWLTKIARNLTIDYLRKKRPLQIIMDIFIKQPDDAPLPAEQVAIKESREELVYALQSLNRKYREVIILRKVKGFSTQETAEILGWSDSNVKVTLHRAMKALKTALTKGGYVHEAT